MLVSGAIPCPEERRKEVEAEFSELPERERRWEELKADVEMALLLLLKDDDDGCCSPVVYMVVAYSCCSRKSHNRSAQLGRHGFGLIAVGECGARATSKDVAVMQMPFALCVPVRGEDAVARASQSTVSAKEQFSD